VLIGALALVGCSGDANDPGDDRPEGPVVGSQAPGFSLEASEGDRVSLDDFAGRRPVLLYFSMGPG
jgi:hypothetical protein